MSAIQSTPWPIAFPHIVKLQDGRTVELSCPYCEGNAWSRGPFDFLVGAKGVLGHVRRVHGGRQDHLTTVAELLSSAGSRVLTASGIDAIASGEYGDILAKRKVIKKDGEQSEVVQTDTSIPIPHYPIIAFNKEGQYVQLACKFCEGNAQTKKSMRSSANGAQHLVFYNGVAGFRGHLQAHKAELHGEGAIVSNAWVVEHCSTMLDQTTVDKLKADVNCKMIAMKKAVSHEDPTKRGPRKKKDVASDSGITTGGEVADGAEEGEDDDDEIIILSVSRPEAQEEEEEEEEEEEDDDITILNVARPAAQEGDDAEIIAFHSGEQHHEDHEDHSNEIDGDAGPNARGITSNDPIWVAEEDTNPLKIT